MHYSRGPVRRRLVEELGADAVRGSGCGRDRRRQCAVALAQNQRPCGTLLRMHGQSLGRRDDRQRASLEALNELSPLTRDVFADSERVTPRSSCLEARSASS
jgi:hypothetical protein